MNILQVKELNLELGGKKILNNVNVDFWDGHVHAIVGPNGAGKSTLASTIMGLEGYTHFTGDILFEGKSIKNMGLDERARKGITFGWQEPARYVGLTVRQFIRASALDKSDDNIREMLSAMGLEPSKYMNRAVDKTLSGGERKKVEVASILAMKPKLVMLDEPDSGIDVSSLEKIFDAIKLLRANGATVILITHSLAVLEQAEHAFLMCGGEIVEKGVTEKITPYFEGKCLPCDHTNIPSEEELEEEFGGEANE